MFNGALLANIYIGKLSVNTLRIAKDKYICKQQRHSIEFVFVGL